MTIKPRNITIFEGPDGAGKTTVARAYVELTGARYVHFDAMPRINKGLGRIYVEAMLPALLGYQDVVMDRSWLSEAPYAAIFRDGNVRTSLASRRMLERLALRCGAVVVQCYPPWEAVLASYRARRHLEMLESEEQLRHVYELYATRTTGLATVTYDYTTADKDLTNLVWDIDDSRFPLHPVGQATAGNLLAPHVLIGQSYAERKAHDAFYQWPFASFSGNGCSQWLTNYLIQADISEYQLLWCNADQDLTWMEGLDDVKIIALGNVAHDRLLQLGHDAVLVPHPQVWRRFNTQQLYPLAFYLDRGFI